MKQTRREHLSGIGALGTTTLASFAPTTDTGAFGWSPPENAKIHSNDRPSWIIPVKGETTEERTKNLNELEEEIQEHDDSFLVEGRRHDEAGVATVVAPASVIGARQRDRTFDNGIQRLSYIDESGIEINRVVSLADPVIPSDEGAWRSYGFVESTALTTFAKGVPQPDGVAFNGDMEEDAMLTVRRVTDATADDLGGLPDTSSLTIAIVDTGVSEKTYLNDSSGNTRLLPASTNFIESGDPSGVGATTDGNGHGDWIAACYAARTPSDSTTEGFLPAANVLACKALDDSGSGNLSDIAAAIRHAADQGADIIQLSLGAPQYSAAIENALAYAVSKGSIPIAAAGNDRQGTRWLAYPASSEYTISVGATTVDPAAEALSAYYSNTGPHNGYTDSSGGKTAGMMPDVGAPGCKIESASGDTLTGTSMAAPVVGGILGLDLATGTKADLKTARNRLKKYANPIPKASEEEVGQGMPNAANMVNETEPAKDQADAETTEAAARGAAYEYLSNARITTTVAEVENDIKSAF